MFASLNMRNTGVVPSKGKQKPQNFNPGLQDVRKKLSIFNVVVCE